MSGYFQELCDFFGIVSAPANFAEFVPWFFTVLVAIGIVLACFRLVFACINAGRWLR